MRTIAAISLVACAAVLPGCLQRTLSISSTPPGAVVWINDVEVGTTPLDVDFTYYGGYDVRVRREGYEPILEKKKIDAPIRELPVVDLAAEVIPAKFENRVEWHFDLTRVAERGDASPAVAEQALIARANELRGQIPPPALKPDAPAGAADPGTK